MGTILGVNPGASKLNFTPIFFGFFRVIPDLI